MSTNVLSYYSQYSCTYLLGGLRNLSDRRGSTGVGVSSGLSGTAAGGMAEGAALGRPSGRVVGTTGTEIVSRLSFASSCEYYISSSSNVPNLSNHAVPNSLGISNKVLLGTSDRINSVAGITY